MKPRTILLLTLLVLTLLACGGSAALPTPDAAPLVATTAPADTAAATTPFSPTPDSAAAPNTGFLRVQGTDVVDGTGQPIRLRGINMDTYYYSYVWDAAAPSQYATQADIQFLADLGANVIRLALHWQYFETGLGYELIDSYLAWCEQVGIYVILDMHVVPPEIDILESRIWDDPAAQQQFIDLWVEIAARYADHPHIAGYDLYNEPAPDEAGQWWALAEQSAAAIRTVDNNHILFVENPLSADWAFRLIPDANVVYSYHDYTPFLVSHAGADWVGDSPMPVTFHYPGPVIEATEWADWSQDATQFTDATADWLYWDSGPLTVPEGVEFATLKPNVWGNVGQVWFDDMELSHNGVPQAVFNPDMEKASVDDASQPANWHFWSDTGYTGTWSNEAAHSGAYSLKINGTGDGFGIWTQSEWVMIQPLFPVQAGDTLQVRGWFLAPENNGGGISLGVDYLNGVYSDYDRTRLQADIQPYLDWAAAHQVPLLVGEFGAMATAPGNSRNNLIADKISLMNEAGLHWTLWTYRALTPNFGLYTGEQVDEGLAGILRLGLSQ